MDHENFLIFRWYLLKTQQNQRKVIRIFAPIFHRLSQTSHLLNSHTSVKYAGEEIHKSFEERYKEICQQGGGVKPHQKHGALAFVEELT